MHTINIYSQVDPLQRACLSFCFFSRVLIKCVLRKKTATFGNGAQGQPGRMNGKGDGELPRKGIRMQFVCGIGISGDGLPGWQAFSDAAWTGGK